ncbi:hypothetical protein SAMN03159358_4640 [Paenibacillus sp. NFR01]|nr:hypothetical protein SAMN03159358_4640 [Paenibacillus sp. NFR01]
MGQRANLIIVKNGAYDLYYSHWCANTLPEDIFWGERYAIPFIEQQRAVDACIKVPEFPRIQAPFICIGSRECLSMNQGLRSSRPMQRV